MITEKSIKLFQRAAENIPAYKKLLQENGIQPASISTVADFKTLPVLNKKSYLQSNSRADLIWLHSQSKALWYCSTSGSTGEPYYFPRTDEIAARGSWFAESFLDYSSHGHSSTLVIIAFGMGVWIGGVVTLRSFEIAAERTPYPVAFLPTGYNKTEIFKSLRQLSPDFSQTILVGYPPFIKEVLDELEGESIDPMALNLRLMFAAEAFTETFRDYVCEKGKVTSKLLDTLNIYGTADVGALAYETPVSILVRQLALNDPLIFRDIFGQTEKTPTLAQYHPEFVEFEEVENELIITSDGAIPLVRYAIGDNGGVISYEDVEKKLSHHGIDLSEEINKNNIDHTINKRPFVYVYERKDLAATLHGIIIYPEFIKEGLLNPKILPFCSERFTMTTKNDIHHNQYLEINLELITNVEESNDIRILAYEVLRDGMIKNCSEFAEISKSRDAANLIKIVFWPNGHPKYFAPGAKQKWVK